MPLDIFIREGCIVVLEITPPLPIFYPFSTFVPKKLFLFKNNGQKLLSLLFYPFFNLIAIIREGNNDLLKTSKGKKSVKIRQFNDCVP